ncbi:MAG: hypothetical protein Q9214_001543 [Letrouitia sp. 1 TL-2023]
MQKILRRTAKAEAQYTRRTRHQRSKEIADDRLIQIRRQKIAHSDVRALRLAAIKARHEDWELGPLAPRRDIGTKKDTYGAVPYRLIEKVHKPEGTWKDWGIRQGDRVVVVGKKERDRGRIGTVREVSQESETVTVEGINTVRVETPSFLIQEGQTAPPTQDIPAPLPLSSVRLVFPLPTPEGRKVDTIISALSIAPNGHRTIADYVDPEDGKPFYLPYPKPAPPEHQDHPSDTLRIKVEEETWVPSLLRQPMPENVIDELRNKYSKFRTRHDDAYIAKKMQEEAEAAWKKEKAGVGIGGMDVRMMTPGMEKRWREAMERKGKKEPELSEDILGRIGEVMMRNGFRLKEERGEEVVDDEDEDEEQGGEGLTGLGAPLPREERQQSTGIAG